MQKILKAVVNENWKTLNILVANSSPPMALEAANLPLFVGPQMDMIALCLLQLMVMAFSMTQGCTARKSLTLSAALAVLRLSVGRTTRSAGAATSYTAKQNLLNSGSLSILLTKNSIEFSDEVHSSTTAANSGPPL
jgi:hypothetical protein